MCNLCFFHRKDLKFGHNYSYVKTLYPKNFKVISKGIRKGIRKSLNVERIHLDFCKHILGVKKSTCTAAVYAELGRFPLLYHRKFAFIKYWSKLIYCNNCILLNCYNKLFDEVENHKKINWVSDVKNCLIDLGFNEIWNAQRCNEGTLCVMKQRIFDQAKQEIFACIENSSKCSFYRYLISQHCLQYYLTKPIPAKFQKCIA